MYRRVKMEGSVIRKFPLTMRTLRTPDIHENRVGFVVRKKAGSAVFRNAIRRVLREKFRQTMANFVQPAWVIFEVSDRVAESTRSDLHMHAQFLLSSLCQAHP